MNQTPPGGDGGLWWVRKFVLFVFKVLSKTK